jgi:YHS domain-containing protein
MQRFNVTLFLCLGGATLLAAGCSTHSADHPSVVPASAAVDLHNTVCPVSGDEVGKSDLTEVYNGKIYHLCCDDCPKEFKSDPQKYAARVEANPTKYGVHP